MWIREMAQEDIEAVAQLEKECFTDAWSEVLLSNMLSNSYDKVWVLEDGGRIIGYANLRDLDGEGDLMSICVTGDMRRRGCGKLLMDRVMSYAAAKEMKTIYLEVRESNAPARAMYGIYGFEPYARRKRYYTEPVEDAIIYKLELRGK